MNTSHRTARTVATDAPAWIPEALVASQANVQWLLRLGSFLVVLAVLAGFKLSVQVSTDRLTQDIRDYEIRTRHAEAVQGRLHLDLETRRSTETLEQAAHKLGLGPAVTHGSVTHAELSR